MKKIRCPRCAVINLEGFVTYPNCAGCGALLEGANEAVPEALWRKRQLGPLLWATVVGVAILLMVVVAAGSFQRPPDEPARIVMLGHAPSQVHAGEVFALKLLIDAMDGAVRREPEPLRDVNLRLPRGFFGRFALMGLQPLPDRVTELGSGRYFYYQEIARGTTLVMTLRALRPGKHDVSMRVRERGLTTVGYRTRIVVVAPRQMERRRTGRLQSR